MTKSTVALFPRQICPSQELCFCLRFSTQIQNFSNYFYSGSLQEHLFVSVTSMESGSVTIKCFPKMFWCIKDLQRAQEESYDMPWEYPIP
jgi:hypothetical protein